jgi:hypothetical protein
LNPQSKRKAAERLVEQSLISREMELSRYPAPDLSDIEPMLREIIRLRLGGETAYQATLARSGVTEQDLKQHLLWQLTLLRFVEMRFRPAVQVSEDEIREYFDKQIKVSSGGEKVSLEDFRDRIEQALTGERADKEMDAWLKEAKARTKIVYHPEAFQ